MGEQGTKNREQSTENKEQRARLEVIVSIRGFVHARDGIARKTYENQWDVISQS